MPLIALDSHPPAQHSRHYLDLLGSGRLLLCISWLPTGSSMTLARFLDADLFDHVTPQKTALQQISHYLCCLQHVHLVKYKERPGYGSNQLLIYGLVQVPPHGFAMSPLAVFSIEWA